MELKQRLDTFVDAIIAIIITVMVLELPININNGVVDYRSLIVGLGGYAISFCFVANVWYQHAVAFTKIKTVKRNLIVSDLLLILLLSLVPAATRLMTEAETNDSVIIYGVLYLIITIWLRIIVKHIMDQQFNDAAEMKRVYSQIYTTSDSAAISFTVLAIICAYFFPKIAMIWFIVLTVHSFFSNMNDREIVEDVAEMNKDGRETFLNMNAHDKRAYGKLLRQYITEIRQVTDDDEKNRMWGEFMKKAAAETGLSEQQLGNWFNAMRDAKKRGGGPQGNGYHQERLQTNHDNWQHH